MPGPCGPNAGPLASARQVCLIRRLKAGTLTPRGVHGYFTRLMAKRLGSDLDIERPAEGRLVFRAKVAAV